LVLKGFEGAPERIEPTQLPLFGLALWVPPGGKKEPVLGTGASWVLGPHRALKNYFRDFWGTQGASGISPFPTEGAFRPRTACKEKGGFKPPGTIGFPTNGFTLRGVFPEGRSLIFHIPGFPGGWGRVIPLVESLRRKQPVIRGNTFF